MRRLIVALSAAALAASALAFTPAPQTQQQDATHTVSFTEDGTKTVYGGPPGGVNLTPFNPLGSQQCTDEVDGYCETVLIEVQQPVANEDEQAFELGTGSLSIETTSNVPGGDFDIFLYESTADGYQGKQLDSSGNAPGCAVNCATPAHFTKCSGADECITVDVDTNEADAARFYLLEVYYFATPDAHTTVIGYERTDGRNALGGTGAMPADPTRPADSVERFDIATYQGYDLEHGGDWGGGGDLGTAGSAAGQDFTAAYLEYRDDTFFFVLELTELPPVGGTPEATRYGWSFRYNDLELELDGKFTNFSRGTCDPTAGSCPPPRYAGLYTFLLRGNCYTDSSLPMSLTLCEEFARIPAQFDTAASTITIPIPANVLAPEGVKACDEIVGMASFIGDSIWAAPSAFITNTLMPFDDVAHMQPLVVPPADAELSCS